MTKKVGIYSSIVLLITVTIFNLSLLFSWTVNISYFVCIILAWSYVVLACSYAAKTENELKVFSLCGVAFSCLYAVIINIVYFTQLTIVTYGNLSNELRAIFDFSYLGSLMFSLDLLGYGLMAISTFFIGLTIKSNSKSNKWLKYLLLIHGIFAIQCVLMPLMNVFNSSMGGEGDIFGVLALIFWCYYFTPIGILSIFHFKRL